MTTIRRAAALAATAAVVLLATIAVVPTVALAHESRDDRTDPYAVGVMEQPRAVASRDASSSTVPAPPSGTRSDQRNIQILAGSFAAIFVLAGGLVFTRLMRRQDR